MCTPSVGRAGSCRRREGSGGFPAGGRCLQLPLGQALPTLFLHHLGSLGHRVPAAGGWEEEEEGQAVPQPYLAGAGLPLGRTGGPCCPPGVRRPRLDPRRRRQGHHPGGSPGASAASTRPRTPESLKRLFFPGSGAGGKGQEKEGGAGGERLAGQEPGGVLARTGKEPVPVQPGRLRESRQRSGRAHRARPEQRPLAMGTEPRVSPAAPGGGGGPGAELREDGGGCSVGDDLPPVTRGRERVHGRPGTRRLGWGQGGGRESSKVLGRRGCRASFCTRHSFPEPQSCRATP